MKILAAVVAVALAFFLFYQAHDLEGISLIRFGYIGGAVALITGVFVIFLPKQHGDDNNNPPQ